MHAVVDTLGHLLALHVALANEGDRAEVAELAKAVQDITALTVEVAFVDQGYTGEATGTAAAEHGIRLEVVKLPEAKCGFVLLPRRWWLSGPSAGPPASAASSAITRDCPKPSAASISSPSPASCSNRPPWRAVTNSLQGAFGPTFFYAGIKGQPPSFMGRKA